MQPESPPGNTLPSPHPPGEPIRANASPAVAGTAFRVNNFDLLRILAALQVMVIHSMARLGVPVPGGLKWLEWFPGVPIFFVISGYLVSASFERQDNLWRYLKNRFLRIYPGLWACIGVTVIVTTILGYKRTHLLDFAWLPAQLLGLIYTPEFLKHFGVGTYNGSLWTIPIELQFYLVLPLVYFARQRFRKSDSVVPVLLGLFIVIVLILNYALPGFNTQQETRIDKVIRYTFVSSFYLFLLGVALQRVHAFRSKIIAGKALYWIAGYVLLMLVLPEHLSPVLMVLSYLVLGITTVSVAYTVPKAGEQILRGQDISYGVYIYHGLVINLLVEMNMRPGLYEIGIVVISTLVLGAVSWKLVEQPFLRKKKRKLEAASAESISPVREPESALRTGV
jgi:peptidoglycan/LPS O-acetylase OafA/YrhL